MLKKVSAILEGFIIVLVERSKKYVINKYIDMYTADHKHVFGFFVVLI